MSGLQRWRRTLGVVVSAVAVVASGLPGIPPELAATPPAPAAPVAPPPELSWPKVEPVIPADAPMADGTLAVPDDWAAPVPKVVRDARTAPVRAAELVERRDATTAVWKNTDGTETVILHSRPTHFQPADAAAWEPIDVRVIADPDRPGGLRTTAGPWTARFAALQPGGVGGLELTTPAGPTRSVPDLAHGHAPIAPVVGDEGRRVTYANVWPGSDLRYTVTPRGLVQTIVIREPDCESFRFLVEGLSLTDGEVTGVQAGTLNVESGEVARGPKGRPSDKLARPALHVRDADPALVGDDPAIPGTPQDVELTVAGSWLDRALGADEGPVVVDTPSLVGPQPVAAHRKLDGEETPEARTFATGVRVGHQPGEPAALWRSTIGFAYQPVLQGKQVLEARLWLAERADGNERTAGLRVRSGLAGSYDSAASDGKDWAKIEVKPGIKEVTADLTDLVTTWQTTGDPLRAVGLVAADEDTPADSFVRFDDARLELRLNSPAPPPALLAPGPDALATISTTPTLSWSPVTDPDGDPVQYVAQVASGLDGDSGLVAASPPGTANSWQVPAGLLQDGGSYTWRVFASDGRAWTPSDVRRITVDRRAGSAPTDAVGPLTTNLVTGASTLLLDGPALATVRGDVGLRLAHESQGPPTGLVGTYRADLNRNTTIDDADPVRLIRTDPQLSFAWNRPGAAAPSPGVPAEWFSVRWAGFLTLPAGDWQLGVRAGDGVRVDVAGEQVLDRWRVGPPAATPTYQDGTLAGGTTREIEVEYFQAAEDAALELWVRKAETPAQAFVVPAAWLSPSEPVLPAGWSASVAPTDVPYVRAVVGEGGVTLAGRDGSVRTFRKTPGGGAGYAPPPGAEDVVTVNPDGTVAVRTPEGRDLVFGPGGGLANLASAADDRAPAAVVPTNDDTGRLTKLTDPVSGRSIRLVYGPSDACPASPGGPLAPAPAGMLCQVAYWDGTTTDLFYGNGLLAYVRNPGDAYWGLGYDPAGRLVDVLEPRAVDATLAGMTDVAKAAHHIARDETGRVSAVARPEVTPGLRATRSYGYTPVTLPAGELVSGRTIVARSGLPDTFRSVTYDARGRLTADTDAVGQTTTFTWDADDRLIAVDRPDGVRTTTRYDRLGLPVSRWGPAPAPLFAPDGSGGVGVPHEQLRYDEGLAGQQVQYWANPDLAGPPVAHGWEPGSLSALAWDGAPPADGLAADGWSARFSGSLAFPAAGTYALQVNKDDRARVFVDDQLVIDAWDTPAGWSPEVPFTVAQAGEAHRLRVDLADVTGPTTLELQWKPPGAAAREKIPDGQFMPDFGLLTTRVDGDGITVSHEYADPPTGIGPHHHLAVRTALDPAGLRLADTFGFEPPGVGHLRPIAHTRPAGPETQATTGYYGDREERDNPCTRPADPANQAGLVQLERGPDPDGDGPGLAQVREVVHDGAGRIVATKRTGDTEWTCTDYDARGRVTEVRHPAVGRQPARTTTTDHTTPLKVAVTDEVGTITTESNLWGQPTATTDVFGHRTVTTYDEQGRAVLTDRPGGALATVYDNADRIVTVGRDGQALTSGIVYDPAGRLTAVTLGNGVAGTLAYDVRDAVTQATWTGIGGTPITSDEVRRRAGGGLVERKIDGVDHHPGDDYVYDTAGRLTDVWAANLHASFQFAAHEGCGPLAAAGANSNLTDYLREGGPVTCYCYDRADRLTAADTVAGNIRYDAHDNIDGVFGEARRYDAADRLVEIVNGATTVAYRRDATGRIVERQLNGTVVARYGDGFTTDAGNVVVESQITLPGGVLVTSRPAGAVWSLPNAEGAPAAVTDQAATKLGDTLRYDPYGNLLTGAVPDTTTGNLDHTPHGLLEHEPGIQPVLHRVIEGQGTRQYSLTLGRDLTHVPPRAGDATLGVRSRRVAP